MKAVLQNKSTKLYLGNSGEWTPDIDDARSFTSTWEALEFCKGQALPPTKVLMKFDNARYDIPVADCP